MIVKPDHDVFNYIYWKLYEMKPKSFPKRHMCNIFSSILAYHLTQFTEDEIYIIDSKNHSVVFDGESTWDLHLGIMFQNYKYPKLPVPNYTKIPKFFFNYSKSMYTQYYSDTGLSIAKTHLGVKSIKTL